VCSGQASAAFGGTTFHADFIIQPQGQTFAAAFEERRGKANDKQMIDMGCHMAVTDLKSGGTLDELASLLEQAITPYCARTRRSCSASIRAWRSPGSAASRRAPASGRSCRRERGWRWRRDPCQLEHRRRPASGAGVRLHRRSQARAAVEPGRVERRQEDRRRDPSGDGVRGGLQARRALRHAVDSFDRPRDLGFDARNPKTDALVRFHLEPRGESQTEVSCRMELTMKGGFKLAEPLLGPVIRRQIESKRGRMLKRAVEASAVG